MDQGMRFGDFLLSYGIVKRHELAIGLANQELFGGMIGEAMEDCGYLSQDEVQGFLDMFSVEKNERNP